MTTWLTDQARAADPALRRVSLKNPMQTVVDEFGLAHQEPQQGFLPLDSLGATTLRTTFAALAGAGLPFRIKPYGVVRGVNANAPHAFAYYNVQFPPMTISPLGEGMNNFGEFLAAFKDTVYYIYLTVPTKKQSVYCWSSGD